MQFKRWLARCIILLQNVSTLCPCSASRNLFLGREQSSISSDVMFIFPVSWVDVCSQYTPLPGSILILYISRCICIFGWKPLYRASLKIVLAPEAKPFYSAQALQMAPWTVQDLFRPDSDFLILPIWKSEWLLGVNKEQTNSVCLTKCIPLPAVYTPLSGGHGGRLEPGSSGKGENELKKQSSLRINKLSIFSVWFKPFPQ